MILYPAIDILDGKAVRLRQGSYEDKTVYGDDPLEAARAWVDAGARALHVVDLDGAKSGEPKNLRHVERIASSLGKPVQFGGGLRSIDSVNAAFGAGVERVILGTAAYKDVDFLDTVLEEHSEGAVISVDARGGKLATDGWINTTEMDVCEVIRSLGKRGARSYVYTDIDRDGMLEGLDMEEVDRISDSVKGRFIYSGGIGGLEDLEQVAKRRRLNLAGVIVGKALYEKRFTIAEGQAVLDQR